MSGYTGPMEQLRTRALFALLALLLLALAAFTGFARPGSFASYTIGRNVQSFTQLSQRFVALAKAKGAEHAFDVLRTVELPPNTDLHLLGHVVGDELYKQKGVDGIADCTQEFRNACSHTIVIGMLNEFGDTDTTVEMVRDACKKAPGGKGAYTMCFHGLGHGVFAFYAYDLKKTADFCKKTGTAVYAEEEYTQCVGGAIMELMGGGGHDREAWLRAREKYLVEKEPLAPCMSPLIEEAAKTFCFMYLTPRLFEFAGAELAQPDPKTFPLAFSFCDAISKASPRLREACFGGFGKEFIPLVGARDIRTVDRFSNEQYARAAGWCTLSRAKDGQAACVEQAVESVFWGGENDPRASMRFCAVTPVSLQDACFSRVAENLKRYVPESAEMWCRQLPEQYRSRCLLP